MSIRSIKKIYKSRPTIEGAGVHLKRAFGYDQVPEFDPFLMLDDFHTANPDEYLAGFPWHPHRGIETITYVLEGLVEHGDSMGNKGTIGAGDVQWMTAGSGIIHQEMPQLSPTGTMWGLQFWANLPAGSKMMPPRYRDIKSGDIPVVALENGVTAKVIAGEVSSVAGPVTDIVIRPEMLDVTVPAGTMFRRQLMQGHTVFAYILSGAASFDDSQNAYHQETVLLFEHSGDEILVTTTDVPARFLLVSGMPLHEPVAWRGPIVMNTREELQAAFEEYHNGTFVKMRTPT